MSLKHHLPMVWIAIVQTFACQYLIAADLTLRYDKPAPNSVAGWERESLPIGNGRLGGSFFGAPALERFLFNEITLWTGNETLHGAYQAFGDVNITLPGHDSGVTDYVRELDLEKGVGRVRYKKEALLIYANSSHRILRK